MTAPVTDGWLDETFTVYQSDPNIGHGDRGSTLVIRRVDPLNPAEPPCVEGDGGDFCGRDAQHEGPHVRVSAELIAAGFRITTVVEP